MHATSCFDIAARFGSQGQKLIDIRRFLNNRAVLQGQQPAATLEPSEATEAEAAHWMSAVALAATGIAADGGFDGSANTSINHLLDGRLRPALRRIYEVVAITALQAAGESIQMSQFDKIPGHQRAWAMSNLLAAATAVVQRDIKLGKFRIPKSTWFDPAVHSVVEILFDF